MVVGCCVGWGLAFGTFTEQLALPSAPVTVVTMPIEVMPGPPGTVMVAPKVPSAAVVVLTVTGLPAPVGVATIAVAKLAVGGVTNPSTRTVTELELLVPLVKATLQGSFNDTPLVPAWAGRTI